MAFAFVALRYLYDIINNIYKVIIIFNMCIIIISKEDK